MKRGAQSRSDSRVLDRLGELIGGSLAKGANTLEAALKKTKGKSKDRKFMGYVKVLLDDPAVAAVTPSSKFIVDRVVKAMALEKAKVIVEYGAARGVITKRILEKMKPDAKLVAIEFNSELFKGLKKLSDPRLILVRGDVREIEKILAQHGVDKVDAIVSGVPFSFFSNRGRHELLLKTSESLAPGGRFVAYQVTTHLIPLLKDYFSKIDTQFELRNIPPHFIFTAHK